MLRFDRYLSLVYYWIVSRIQDPKLRQRFDNALTTPPPEELQRAMTQAGTQQAREYTPSWWKGEEAAARQGLALAAALGVQVNIPTAANG